MMSSIIFSVMSPGNSTPAFCKTFSIISLIGGVSIVFFTFASICALCSTSICFCNSSNCVRRMINGSTLLAISFNHFLLSSLLISSFAIRSCIERHSFFDMPPVFAYLFSKAANWSSIIAISFETSLYLFS